MNKVINILGTDYVIKCKTKKEDKRLEEIDGYADFTTREIVIEAIEDFGKDIFHWTKMEIYLKEILRHEIIHVFLHESGLDSSTHRPDCWARNEEMIDWIAIQSPKIFKIFKELNIMEDSDEKITLEEKTKRNKKQKHRYRRNSRQRKNNKKKNM